MDTGLIAANEVQAGHDRYGWFVVFFRSGFRSAMPDGTAAKRTAAAPEMESVLKDALEQIEHDHEQIWADDPHPASPADCEICCMTDRIKAVLFKVHPKVLHGECPVCGHHGEDCTGRRYDFSKGGK